MSANKTVVPETADENLRSLASIRRSLIGILILLIIICAYFAKDVVLPVVMGILLTLTLSPIVRSAARASIPPPLTALAVVLLVSGVLGAGAYSLSGPVSEWIDDAPRLGAEVKRKLRGLTSSVEAVKEASREVEKIAEDTSDPTVQKVTIQQPGFLNSAVANATSLVTTGLVTLVLALFLLSSGDMFYVKLVEAFPRVSDKKRALRIVYEIERSVSRYLLTITLINAGLGAAVAVAMAAIGVPQPALWGTAAFLLNFLPFVGSLIGTGLVAAVAIISFDSVSYAFLAPAAYLGLTTLEGQIVTPLILGRRLELNTVAVFLTVVFWGWLWGIPGALMAVPFLVCVKVICDHIDQLKVLGNFLGASSVGPGLDPLRKDLPG